MTLLGIFNKFFLNIIFILNTYIDYFPLTIYLTVNLLLSKKLICSQNIPTEIILNGFQYDYI